MWYNHCHRVITQMQLINIIIKQTIFLGYIVLQLFCSYNIRYRVLTHMKTVPTRGIRRETPDKTTINLVKIASNLWTSVPKTSVEGKCCLKMRTNMRFYPFKAHLLNFSTADSWQLSNLTHNFFSMHLFIYSLMYVCPCIIYEIDERYPLDATIYLLL